MSQPGTLTLVATPIGNLGDITLRAIDVLKSARVILAEDTRHSGRLLSHLGITTPLQPYHDHNEARITPDLVQRLLGGENMALITDAGTPGISDPGFFLVRAALAAGVPVTMAPGPSAILPALVLSGFPCESFVFVGFMPRKPGELARTIDALETEQRTTVFYVSPHQFRRVLEKVAARFPDREIAVARELTKLHEEIVRGPATEVRDKLGPRQERGEFVLVVKGLGWRKRRRDDGPDDETAEDTGADPQGA